MSLFLANSGIVAPASAVSVVPTFVAASAIASRGGTAGSVTPVLPTHQADDIIFVRAVTWTSSSDNITAPAGYNTIATTNSGYGGCTVRYFWKRAASGAEANPAISTTVGTMDVAVWVYRGCVTSGDPFEDATALDNESAMDALSSSIDTLGANRLAVVLGGKYQTSAWASGYPPATWTNDSNISGGNFSRMSAISKSVASAANVPQVTVGVISGAKIWSTLTLALIPA